MSEPCTCSLPIGTTTGRCGYCAGAMPAPRTADATGHPDIEVLPAQTTRMDPTEFANWLASPGTIYLVHLPARRMFPIKVPDEHHAFFVDILAQLRAQLGPEVQAQTAIPVRGDDLYTTVPTVPCVPNGPNVRTAYLPGDGPDA